MGVCIVLETNMFYSKNQNRKKTVFTTKKIRFPDFVFEVGGLHGRGWEAKREVNGGEREGGSGDQPGRSCAGNRIAAMGERGCDEEDEERGAGCRVMGGDR